MCLPIFCSSAVAPAPSAASRYRVSDPKTVKPKTSDLRKTASTHFIQVVPSSASTTVAVDRSTQGVLPRLATVSNQTKIVKLPKVTAHVSSLRIPASLPLTITPSPTSQTQAWAAVHQLTALPSAVVDLITDYTLPPIPQRKQEVALLQALVLSLKNNDPNAYAKLAQLIQNGLSLALLWMVDVWMKEAVIPNFYSQLAAAIPWESWESLDEMPFKTSRTLERDELYAHLYMFKKLLEGRTDPWSIKKTGVLDTKMEELGIAKAQIDLIANNVVIFSRKSLFFPGHFRDYAAINLWLNMVEVFYPYQHYQINVYLKDIFINYGTLEINLNPQKQFIHFIPKSCTQTTLHVPTVWDWDKEAALYQQLLPDLKNNDLEAYKKLAQLLQAGHSAAPLAFLSAEIPDFYPNLTKAISWNEIPFTTIRSLEFVERINHLGMLQSFLYNDIDIHPTAKEEQENNIRSIFYPMIDHQTSKDVTFSVWVELSRIDKYKCLNHRIDADSSNLKASAELWLKMAKLLYPNNQLEFVTQVSSNEEGFPDLKHTISLQSFILMYPDGTDRRYGTDSYLSNIRLIKTDLR